MKFEKYRGASTCVVEKEKRFCSNLVTKRSSRKMLAVFALPLVLLSQVCEKKFVLLCFISVLGCVS